MFPSYYILGALQLAKADSARVGLAIEHTRDADDVVEPPRGGLPRLMTIEVRPEEVGPSGVKLDEASRAKLAAAGVDVEQVEREIHGMRPGDKKLLGEVVYGAERDVPPPGARGAAALVQHRANRRGRGAYRPRRDRDLPGWRQPSHSLGRSTTAVSKLNGSAAASRP